MQIIKPQQLIFLKNTYQIENDCYLGISIISGFQLTNNNHFVTEPQIWDAWEKSPKSVPFLDVPTRKSFAEFVLVGHADVGKKVSAIDAHVKMGSIKKEWRISGDGSYIKTNAFQRMAMDHTNTWGGDQDKYNPLGKGSKIGGPIPNVILRKDYSLIERSPLASPSPIPYEYYERKQYIDNIAPIMNSKYYLDKIYPGLPKELDTRYFQISAPDQWSKDLFWKDGSEFELFGFAKTDKIITGKLPSVKGRIIAVDKKDNFIEIPTLLQTIWFMPDFNLCLMVHTGVSILSEHILDDPYKALILSLDSLDNIHNIGYFKSIYKKRTNKNSLFEFLLDNELMLGVDSFNVINSIDKHPYSINYQNKSTTKKELNSYIENINNIIILSKNNEKKDIEDVLKLKKDMLESKDIFVNNNDIYFENKQYKSLEKNIKEIKGKEFKFCSFANIIFNQEKTTECTFDSCFFYNCSFENINFKSVIFNNSEFYICKFNKNKFYEANISNCLYQKVNFNSCAFNSCDLLENKFNKSNLIEIEFIKDNIISCIFEKSKINKSLFDRSKIEKISIISSYLNNSVFIKSIVKSFVTGLESNIRNNKFEDCWLEKMGFGKGILIDSIFFYCSIKEINCMEANLTRVVFKSCDIDTPIFKDAILNSSKWIESSIQQGIFYNAILLDASFKFCNLVGSNFAMVLSNEDTKYKDCLLDSIVWIPKRKIKNNVDNKENN